MVDKMDSKSEKRIKVYSNKGRLVFVASQDSKTCPTINFSDSSNRTKLRDDFSKGLKTKKSFTKLIFK